MTRGVYCSMAYCLHVRSYRETSAIARLFTKEAGRISIVAKGIKSPGRKRRQSLSMLQPFTPLQVVWRGKGELKTLASIEPEGQILFLQGRALFAGMYINELLNAFLLEQQEHPELFLAYQETLRHLAVSKHLELILRRFERFLLEQLGYGIAFEAVDEQGAHSGPLMASHYYRYVPESGFVEVFLLGGSSQENIFSGEHLCKIATDDLDSLEVLRAAKLLMRQALSALLGDKALNSRQLFI